MRSRRKIQFQVLPVEAKVTHQEAVEKYGSRECKSYVDKKSQIIRRDEDDFKEAIECPESCREKLHRALENWREGKRKTAPIYAFGLNSIEVVSEVLGEAGPWNKNGVVFYGRETNHHDIYDMIAKTSEIFLGTYIDTEKQFLYFLGSDRIFSRQRAYDDAFELLSESFMAFWEFIRYVRQIVFSFSPMPFVFVIPVSNGDFNCQLLKSISEIAQRDLLVILCYDLPAELAMNQLGLPSRDDNRYFFHKYIHFDNRIDC